MRVLNTFCPREQPAISVEELTKPVERLNYLAISSDRKISLVRRRKENAGMEATDNHETLPIMVRRLPIRILFLTVAVVKLVIFTSLGPALADPIIRELNMEGIFHGTGEGVLDLQIIAVDFDLHRFGIAIQTGARDCSGDLRGVAKAPDATTIVLAKKKVADRSCSLVLKFSNDFQKVAISGKNCSYYHGASCSFDGVVHRIKPSW
jgi:hypothetical protein